MVVGQRGSILFLSIFGFPFLTALACLFFRTPFFTSGHPHSPRHFFNLALLRLECYNAPKFLFAATHS
jgi:hypothetical protein